MPQLAPNIQPQYPPQHSTPYHHGKTLRCDLHGTSYIKINPEWIMDYTSTIQSTSYQVEEYCKYNPSDYIPWYGKQNTQEQTCWVTMGD